MKAAHAMIPFSYIVKATDGDIETINHIVKHYVGYIAKLSLRPMSDGHSNQYMVVDEVLRRRLETRLISKILSFEIGQE